MAITYQAGRRIQGTSTDFGTAGAGIPAVSGGWKELGRTTLGSANAATTVSSLADKRYYMILHNGTGYSGFGNCEYRLGNSTIDTGNNYASRESNNGAADVPRASQPSNYIAVGYQDYDEDFSVSYVSNLASKDKLIISHNVAHDGTGATNAPERNETVGKWAKTGNPLMDIFNRYNSNGTQAIGSELVVLGWDPADTHTDNFWEELASVNLSGGSADLLSSGTISAKKYLWVQFYVKKSGSIVPEVSFNDSTGNEYSYRFSDNGASDGTPQVNKSAFRTSTDDTNSFVNMFIINNSGQEKLAIVHSSDATTTGALAAPSRREIVAKWTGSSQITKIDIDNVSSGSFDTASTMKVWGSN